MTAGAAAACRAHPTRDAVAVCMVCRARVCAECTTRVDGVNHCVVCLSARAAAARETRDPSRRPPTGAGLGGWVAVAGLSALVWALVEGAFP